MNRVFLLATLCACAAPKPPPPPRVADTVEIIHVQIGWAQLNPGQPYRPPVEVVNHPPAPDPVHAEQMAHDVLAQCEKGAPMAPLQQKYSESDLGTMTINDATHVPYRDVALSLKPGECTMMRTDGGFHVIKRVR